LSFDVFAFADDLLDFTLFGREKFGYENVLFLVVMADKHLFACCVANDCSRTGEFFDAFEGAVLLSHFNVTV